MIPRRQSLFLTVGAILFTGLVLLCLYGSAKNFWTYARMRTVSVEVVASSLHTDITPARELFHILKLDLRSTAGDGRTLHVEEELEKPYYPEEAYDVLTDWSPGARHTVHILRGEAREVRLPGLQRNPERNNAFGYLFLAGFLTIFALVFSAAALEHNPLLARLRTRFKLGAWIVFFGVGLLPLTGAFAFAWHALPQFFTWPTVTATLVETRPAPPPNVTITPAAREYAAGPSHRLFRFPWNGREFYAGSGDSDAPYDDVLRRHCSLESTCAFKIAPHDRWSAVSGLTPGKDFFVPFGAMLFFGVAFCGAGLAIRRSER